MKALQKEWDEMRRTLTTDYEGLVLQREEEQWNSKTEG